MQTRNKNFTIRTTVFDSIPYQHWTGTLTDTNGKSRSHAPRHKKMITNVMQYSQPDY